MKNLRSTFSLLNIIFILGILFAGCNTFDKQNNDHKKTNCCETNKSLIQQYYDEVVNTRNVDSIDKFIADDINYYRAEHKGDQVGKKAFIDIFNLNTQQFDNIKFDIIEMIAEGDKVMVRIHGTAIYKPTKGAVDVEGVRIYTIKNGKIVEKREFWDDVQLLLQTGKIPPFDYEPNLD